MTNVVERLFLVLLCLLCIFGDTSVKIFFPPFKKSVCFSSPLCILNASLLIGVRIYKCFLTVCGFFFFFNFLNMSVWRRQWHPTPVLLPGKSHRWRSLGDFSPWGREELDMTERLHFHFSLSCIGEGNGNPLQCSCLENPRDRSLVGCHLWGCTELDTTEVT